MEQAFIAMAAIDFLDQQGCNDSAELQVLVDIQPR